MVGSEAGSMGRYSVTRGPPAPPLVPSAQRPKSTNRHAGTWAGNGVQVLAQIRNGLDSRGTLAVPRSSGVVARWVVILPISGA